MIDSLINTVFTYLHWPACYKVEALSRLIRIKLLRLAMRSKVRPRPEANPD
jgi:hypothetical protein